MSEFVPNPGYWPHLEAAIMQEMDAVRARVQREVRQNLTPASIRPRVRLKTSRAKRVGMNEIGIWVGYGSGLGPIFESGTKQRRTRSGANRGRITTANHAMQQAREAAVKRGLTFRYL